jgi:hypothetical protein
MSDGGFLSRWSKLKQTKAAPEPVVPTEIEDSNLIDANFIAALPKIEELTAHSDFRAFLMAGVPQSLRNAALARMYRLDPSIRDYVSEALDYAEDFNNPAGISGFGGLSPGDDPMATVARLMGAEPEPIEREKIAQSDSADVMAEASPSTKVEDEAGAAEAEQRGTADAPQTQARPEPRAPTRRHGSALPA